MQLRIKDKALLNNVSFTLLHNFISKLLKIPKRTYDLENLFEDYLSLKDRKDISFVMLKLSDN